MRAPLTRSPAGRRLRHAADPAPSAGTDGTARAARSPEGLKLLFVLLAVFLLLTGVIAYANRWFISYLTSTTPHAITYQVTGSGTAQVAYQAPDGRTTDTVSLPWEVTVTMPDGAPLSLVASAEGQDSITCRIKWEGHTIRIDTQVGSTPATCSSSSTS